MVGVGLRKHKQIGMWLKRDWTSLQYHLFTTTNMGSMFLTSPQVISGLKNVLGILVECFIGGQTSDTVERIYSFIFELK